MTAYISTRDALIRDIKSEEGDLIAANEFYAKAERKLHREQNVVSYLYDGLVTKRRNVDRLKKALSIIEGEGDE